MKKHGIYTLDSVKSENKTILLRVDINEPINRELGLPADDTRIRACLPTIKELTEKGAKLVLLAHQGSDIEYQNFFTLQGHAHILSKLLDKKVDFLPDTCGPAAIQAVRSLKPSQILLLENVRFVSEEQTLFERHLNLSIEEQSQTLTVRTLAPLANYYICDAFAAAHRSQPSLCGFEAVLPSAMGRLFEKEFEILTDLIQSPSRPCVFVLGGAKIADAFQMMDTVLSHGIADTVLTGGLVANILLAAKGVPIGSASLQLIQKMGYGRFLESAKPLLEKYGAKLLLPADLAYLSAGKRAEAPVSALPDDAPLVDIGCQTVTLYSQYIKDAQTVFVNGPMGIFEQPETAFGTKEIWKALAETTGFTVLGGGDSITATNQFHLAEKMGYLCTGGGALIRFLSGEELPVVRALRYAAGLFPLED